MARIKRKIFACLVAFQGKLKYQYTFKVEMFINQRVISFAIFYCC